jgi:hypothetical protein
MESHNPFKELEPDDSCPPHLKIELVSEIDFIRNAITVIELYVGDLFGPALALLDPPNDSPDSV